MKAPFGALHRDLLLPCGFLSTLDDEPDVVELQKKRVTRQSRDIEDKECPENSGHMSSDEDDYIP